jgi:hypothetical protein
MISSAAFMVPLGTIPSKFIAVPFVGLGLAWGARSRGEFPRFGASGPWRGVTAAERRPWAPTSTLGMIERSFISKVKRFIDHSN